MAPLFIRGLTPLLGEKTLSELLILLPFFFCGAMAYADPSQRYG
jgi:hypothetical protein